MKSLPSGPFLTTADGGFQLIGSPEDITNRLSAKSGGFGGAPLWQATPRVIVEAARLIMGEKAPLAERIAAAGKGAGLTLPMVREGFANLFQNMTEDRLRELAENALHEACPSVVRHGLVVGHILAGNLFLSGIESMIHAMLAGARSVVRMSSSDQLFPLAWLEAVRIIEPEAAESFCCGWWPRERHDLTTAMLARCHVAVCFGSDESIAEVHSLSPPAVRFINHGTAVSFAVIGREALRDPEVAESAARRLAYDFSVYDQQGCLSPRAAFFVEADEIAVEKFALRLLVHMRDFERRFPRHPLSLEERAALARERDDCVISVASGDSGALLSAPSDAFLVTVRPSQGYALGGLNRHADLRFGNLESVTTAMSLLVGQLSTLALIGLSESEQEALLSSLRPIRVCNIGEMQKPPLGWTHDGYLPVISLLFPEWQ